MDMVASFTPGFTYFPRIIISRVNAYSIWKWLRERKTDMTSVLKAYG